MWEQEGGSGWLYRGPGYWEEAGWGCPGVGGSPPFLGLAVLRSLVLVPLHTTPKAVEQELNALYDVFLDVSQRWQNRVGLGRWHRRAGDRRVGWPGLTAAAHPDPASRT